MKLYILGKNRDGKGTALEELTSAILSQLGYSVVRNYVGYGGHEIDVEAKYVQHSIGGVKEIPVICECKAHDRPIVTGDWLKFLGKVLVERMENAQTMGVMIALSGVNGNVQSHYDKLPDKSFLSLVCNEQLIEAVCNHYKLKPVEEVKSFVEHKTVRVIDTVELVYYEKEIWWLMAFVHGEFTVLSNNLMPVGEEYLDSFLENLQEVSPYAKDGYRDVLKEDIGRVRMEILARSVVMILMESGQMGFANLWEKTKVITQQPDIDKNELLKTIEGLPYLMSSEDGRVSMKDLDLDGMIEFYRWYLSGRFVVNSIICDFYLDNITEELLDRIVHLQNDIELTDEQKQQSLFIIRLSPSALMYALTPDPIIVRSRNAVTAQDENANKFHTERFLNSLTDSFVADLENGHYNVFYYKEYGLSDYWVENKLSLVFKDAARNREIEFRHHISLIEYNGAILPVAVFEK